MKKSTRRSVLRILAAASFVVTGGIVSQTSAHATSDPNEGIPLDFKDLQNLNECLTATQTFCISNFGIDLNNDGVFEKPAANSGLKFTAYISGVRGEWNSPTLVYSVLLNGKPELAPVVPVGTAITFSLNTGLFEPTPELLTDNDVRNFDVSFVDGKWVTSGTFRTTSKTFAMQGIDPKTNMIVYNKNMEDWVSRFGGIQFYEKPSIMRNARRGLWVSSNASVINELKFFPKTMTWEVLLGGPARKVNGSVNELTYSTFLPDTFIQYAYGTTADVLVNALTTTRTDGDVTRVVTNKISRVTSPIPGIIITIPDIRLFGTVVTKQSVERVSRSFSSNPRIRIKPKQRLLSSPKLQRVRALGGTQIQVTGQAVRGSVRYQAMCSQGLNTVFATSKRPVVTVDVGATGAWKCQIRGAQRVGGRWSRSLTVNVP